MATCIEQRGANSLRVSVSLAIKGKSKRGVGRPSSSLNPSLFKGKERRLKRKLLFYIQQITTKSKLKMK